MNHVRICIIYPLAFPDGKMYQNFHVSFMNILDPAKYHIANELGDIQISIGQSANARFPVDANRNEHVKAIIDKLNPDYLMFLDADMTFPADIILRLLASQKDIVSGMYHYGSSDRGFAPIALRRRPDGGQNYNIVHYYPDEPFWVDAIGMGAALIKADVFKNISFPWFGYQVSEITGVNSISEDMQFCQKAREAGYEIWVDPRVRCGHIKTMVIGENDFLFFQERLTGQLKYLKTNDPVEYEKLASEIIDARQDDGPLVEAQANG